MRISLDGKWNIYSHSDGKNFTGDVPGTVYSALIKNNLIDDPFYGMNEEPACKLSEGDYTFSTEFSVDAKTLGMKHIELCFDGIDTIADITLNGRKLGSADNMHLNWVYDVAGLLKEKNELSVLLCSPIAYAAEKHAARPIWQLTPDMVMEGYYRIRKAHYMYGWDWGPKLPDLGLFRSVYILASDDALIRDVYVRQAHKKDKVTLTVVTECDIFSDGAFSVEYTVTSPDGKEFKAVGKPGEGTEIVIDNPLLWWPNNMGEQHLYKVSARLMSADKECGSKSLKIGLRTMTVSREPDETGEEFCLVVNGVKFFAMGADYIPEDNIIGRRTREKTQKLLDECAECNFNCIRIWGGGFYPDDWFYEICDELGLVLWHDFMFACAIYEYRDEFKDSVLKELRYNIKRARNHPCIGLWCGNNEMEMAWPAWGIERIPEAEEFKKYHLDSYEKDFPAIAKELDPDNFYWPSSPSSGGNFEAPNLPEKGDVHYWDLWHGMGAWDGYKTKNFKFLSEFGFESLPDVRTFEAVIPAGEFYLDSPSMENHQKCQNGNAKLRHYMNAIAHEPEDFEELTYVSQLVQAKMICQLMEYMRSKRVCMGVVYWQLNDTNPVISWASIDYFGRYKALQYTAKRSFAPVIAFIDCDDTSNIRFAVSNETKERLSGVMKYALKDFNGNIISGGQLDMAVEPFSAGNEYVNSFNITDAMKESTYLTCEFNAGDVRAEKTEFFMLLKDLKLKKPLINANITESGDSFVITLSADTLAKDLWLSLKDADCRFSDNSFDVEAGESVTVTVDRKSLSENLSLPEFKNRLKMRSYLKPEA